MSPDRRPAALDTAPSRENAAIGFAAEGFSTRRDRLMGRHAAGEGFLRGFLRHGGVAPATAWLLDGRDGPAFEAQVKAIDPGMTAAVLPQGGLGALARLGTLVLPDPNIAGQARLRRFGDPRAYSITGITHTTASHGAMGLIADLLAHGAEPWDALICTSTAVAATVRELLAAEEERLSARLGAVRFPRPALPVIPLGVEGEAFAPPEASRAASRGAWRARLGAGPEDVVVLSVGRLSWHAKAHPIALFAALGRAARALAAEGGPRLHCVLAGWFSAESQEKAHRALAAALAPEVSLTILDGREETVRREIWAAADAFTLLADNIQETFGLAPVEAMAAGLPVVVSDWNGFRDTVRHGQEGFRIPTAMAPPGSGVDLAQAHAAGALSYDEYLAAGTQRVAVDVAAAAEAFLALARDAGLRARMGAAGRVRVRDTYDWRVVIPQYQALWAELRRIREAAPARATAPDPRRADPSLAFAHYATAPLREADRLAADPAAGEDVRAMLTLPAARHPAPDEAEAVRLGRLLAILRAEGPLTLADLAARIPQTERAMAMRDALWLLKAGFARRD